ncbi:MAG: TIGR03663 family protein, partial [Thermomicrobiales bacterium]|nr:TIGR03663 family protein [Thermomicrobiales bacterium]
MATIATDIASTEDAAASGVRWPAITLETLLYLILFAIAAFTRLHDLGHGALHHDESMHAYYSWRYLEGFGYRHNPLLHGPLLFHLTALGFFLTPESDATARLMPALFGIALVMLPWFLRGPRLLGRWGALSASAFLLISPSIFYYSRHLRHDMFTVTLTLLLFICIVRYLETPERRWLITGAVSTALLLANHEIIFAILALFFGYLYIVMVTERLLVWWNDDRRTAAQLVIAAHAIAVVGVGLIALLTPKRHLDEILTIPWERPTNEQQIEYYQMLATNPMVIMTVMVLLAALGVLIAGLRMARRSDGEHEAGLLDDAPAGSIAAGARAAWHDAAGLVAAVTAGVAVFVLLFTSLFTNLGGLASSTIATNGTLLYWLGQHDVRRGGQPWFYFITMMPQYELIPLFFGFGASVAIGVRAIGAGFGRWSPGENLRFRGMLAIWTLGIFAGLSYAGEKMPWLLVHIALPACLVAGLLVGKLIERAIPLLRRGEIGRPEGLGFALLLIAGGAWLALAAVITQNRLSRTTSDDLIRTQTTWALDHWWLLALPPIAALLITAALVIWRGPQRAILTFCAALLLGLSLFQVHAGWRMTFLEGDVPRDMLIYTQTSPDVTMLAEEFAALSAHVTGDDSLPIYFGGDATWPMWWYLRDFPNSRTLQTPTSPDAIPADAAVVIVNRAGSPEGRLELDAIFTGYTRVDYVLRWAFPETDTYRQFAIAPELAPHRSAWGSEENPHGPIAIVQSILESIGHQLTPEGQQDLYRLIMYRDLTTPITSWATNVSVYVRNDLLPVYNSL